MRAWINMRGSEITGRTTQDFITEAGYGDDDYRLHITHYRLQRLEMVTMIDLHSLTERDFN